jgi:hypothetical protein
VRRFLRYIPDGGGQVAGINPLSLPNLELYLRSDIGVFSDAAFTTPALVGNQVNGWKDQSGNGRHATGPLGLNNFPVYQAGTGNKNTVRFFGDQNTNNQGQLQGTFPITPVTSARGYTFYLWLSLRSVNPTKPISDSQLLLAFETGNGVHLEPDDYDFSVGKRVVTDFVTGQNSALGIQRWSVVYQGPTDGLGARTITVTVNGVVSAGSFAVNMGLQTGYLVSGNGGGNVCCDADVGAILVYSDTHSAATTAGVTQYLKEIFG